METTEHQLDQIDWLNDPIKSKNTKQADALILHLLPMHQIFEITRRQWKTTRYTSAENPPKNRILTLSDGNRYNSTKLVDLAINKLERTKPSEDYIYFIEREKVNYFKVGSLERKKETLKLVQGDEDPESEPEQPKLKKRKTSQED